MTQHYAKHAYASGEKALQQGRWAHIAGELKKAEQHEPGITQDVMARIQELKKDGK